MIIVALAIILGTAIGAGLVSYGIKLANSYIQPNVPSIDEVKDMITETITSAFEDRDYLDEGDSSDDR